MKEQSLISAFRNGTTPPPRLSVVEWADKYRFLAKEAGSTSGRWKTGTMEAARGPMFAVTELGVHIITIMCSTQMLKTSLLENIFGYFADIDPCPILLLQPKDEAAEQFSKERISPLIKITPNLRKKIGDGKMKSGNDTLLYKSFAGGFLAIAGAGSPDNLARRPVRVILADEVDKYPVTREGDPIALAEERTASFGLNWLSVRACSPTVTDESRIEKSYESSDKRLASVACAHCGHRQFLDFFKHVSWEKQGQFHYHETAAIYCECCNTKWSESNRLKALQTIKWHQTKSFYCCGHLHEPLKIYENAWKSGDENAIEYTWNWSESSRHAVYYSKCPDCGQQKTINKHVGFQVSKLYSPWQKDKPSDIAEKWLNAKDDEDLKQTFFNTQLGVTYRPFSGKSLRVESLASRGEIWPAEVPEGVAVITIGADVQDDRLEFEVVGWGKNEESWSIAHEIIDGDLESNDFWARVDTFLKRIWRNSSGKPFEAMAVCMDSGGHHTQKVYDFCKARLGRRIWAIKGESASGGKRNPVWPTKKPTSRTKQSFRPVIIGVNSAKDTIRSRLHLDGFGAGYMHFPHDRDLNWFEQLISERSITKEVAGQRYRVWELPSGHRNEALDCRVYAYAALCGLIHMGLKLNKKVDEASADKNSYLQPVETVKAEAPMQQPVEQPPETKPVKKLVNRLA